MNELTYALYGIRCPTLESASELIARCLDMTFEGRDSSYLGSYYVCKGPNSEKISVRANFNVCEDEWTEPDHLQYPFLLFVDGTTRLDELSPDLELLPEVSFIRKKTLTVGER